MAGELILLPENNASRWWNIEQKIRTHCEEIGLPQDGTDWVLRDIKPRAEKARLTFSLDAPQNVRDMMQVVAKEIAWRHIWCMALLEIELYGTRFLGYRPADNDRGSPPLGPSAA
jgi:hypothetical protein